MSVLFSEVFVFQGEDGIPHQPRSRGLRDVFSRQTLHWSPPSCPGTAKTHLTTLVAPLVPQYRPVPLLYTGRPPPAPAPPRPTSLHWSPPSCTSTCTSHLSTLVAPLLHQYRCVPRIYTGHPRAESVPLRCPSLQYSTASSISTTSFYTSDYAT